MTYQIEQTSDIRPLLANWRVWDGLSNGVPTRELAWLGNWWTIFGKDREAYIVTARDSHGMLCGLLPMYRLKTRRNGRTLCGMGDGATCTDYFTVLTRQSDSATVSAEIGRWLARVNRDARYGWDLINWDGVVGGDRAVAALVEAMRGEGAIAHASSRMSVWVRPTDDDWESHLARLHKKDRQNSRRYRKLLEADGDLKCRTAATNEEVKIALDILIDLHQRRWAAVGEAGSYAHRSSREFLHAAAQDFFDRGQLQLAWLEYNQQPVVSEFRIIGRDRVMYCYSTGMDTNFARLEPGRIIHTQALLYAYDHGLTGINYMRGDEDYKKRMLAKALPQIQLRIVAPSLLPRLRHVVWSTGFEATQAVRRRTGRGECRTLEID